MPGRWLEFSVRTSDVVESLSFYKTLGFAELDTGEMWPHRYAVVTDGDLSIGIHDREFDAPSVTFVQPDLADHARKMIDGGLDLPVMRLDEDVFNEVAFNDRDGNAVCLVEARTFSRASEAPDDSVCGRWFELTLPARDVVNAAGFWAPLAPALSKLREEPTTHMRFDAGGLPLGLSESIALDRPALCFKCFDRDRLQSVTQAAGISMEKHPGYEGAFAMLESPEGSRLYLFDEDFLGEGIEVTETHTDISDQDFETID